MKELIKKTLIEESKKKDLIVPRRLKDRPERYKRIVYKQIQDYIKNGSKGNLWLQGTPIESLPSNLKTVGGYLNLSNSKILEISSDLMVDGNLNLSNTPITTISKGIIIDGWLDLNFSEITTLPSDIKIKYSLFLFNAPITTLPSDLTIGGNLHLKYSSFSKIPMGLKVNGGIDMKNTPLSQKYSSDQIEKMIEDNGGYVIGEIQT